MPLQFSFAIWTAFIVDPTAGEEIVLVAPEGKEEEVITRLSRTGLDCVVGYLGGGYESWTKSGFKVQMTKCVDYEGPEDFKGKTDGGMIVDVRNLGEWQDGVIENATL